MRDRWPSPTWGTGGSWWARSLPSGESSGRGRCRPGSPTAALAEARLAAGREATLFRDRLDLGRYDLAHLRAINRHLFGQVYDWAGQLRTVNMTKSGDLFAVAERIEPPRQLSDLNALHPFREGNGRTQRAFLQLLATQAGWQLAWARVDPDENAAVSSKSMADRNAFAPMLALILVAADEPLPTDALILRHQPGRADPTKGCTPPALAAPDYPTPPEPDPRPDGGLRRAGSRRPPPRSGGERTSDRGTAAQQPRTDVERAG